MAAPSAESTSFSWLVADRAGRPIARPFRAGLAASERRFRATIRPKDLFGPFVFGAQLVDLAINDGLSWFEFPLLARVH